MKIMAIQRIQIFFTKYPLGGWQPNFKHATILYDPLYLGWEPERLIRFAIERDPKCASSTLNVPQVPKMGHTLNVS